MSKERKHIKVKAQNEKGEWWQFETSNFEARVVLHEMDHLDGLLFLDRVASLKTDVFRRKRYTVPDEKTAPPQGTAPPQEKILPSVHLSSTQLGSSLCSRIRLAFVLAGRFCDRPSLPADRDPWSGLR